MVKEGKCGGCSACQLLAPGRHGLTAQNPLGAKVGDQVEVEITAEANRLIPLVVFGVPTLAFIAGLIVGSRFSELLSVVLALGFLGLSFGLVRWFDRYAACRASFQSRIVALR
ncbi:MAG: SoxR reducing system RseC family protein [Candidatus Margulisbacteria bacterium]|jgi:positive regulator of sigma E activity|nr:SoxR reducing system RseC family protein [Candidatus Margulisiibacteriota bacterium]